MNPALGFYEERWFPLTIHPDHSDHNETRSSRRVLIVDDSPVDRHLVGGLVNTRPGWQVNYASSGEEAIHFVRNYSPDVILTDMFMPDMDGVELVTRVKKDFPKTPIVLMTAHGNEELAIQVLQAGAANYVPKKKLAKELHSALDEVLSNVRSEKNHQIVRSAIASHEVQFEIENDISHVSPLVSHIEQLVGQLQFFEPGSMLLIGVALHEALTNAILHGNLELDSKMRDVDEEIFYRAAEERRARDPFKNRKVYFSARMSRDQLCFIIRDEGPGFNPKSVASPFEPENMNKVSGRGMVLISTFMDHVEHNEKGNQITMIKKNTAT